MSKSSTTPAFHQILHFFSGFSGVTGLKMLCSSRRTRFSYSRNPWSLPNGSFRRLKPSKKVGRLWKTFKKGKSKSLLVGPMSNRPIALFLWGAMVSDGCARSPCRQCGRCGPSMPAPGGSQPTTSAYMFLLAHTCSCYFSYFFITFQLFSFFLSLTFSNLLFSNFL